MHVWLIKNAKLPIVGGDRENGNPAIGTEHQAGLVDDDITLVNYYYY